MANVPKRFVEGIILDPNTTNPTIEGEVRAHSTDEVLKTFIEGDVREVVTNDQTQILENKTLDGTDATGTNTISIDASDASYDNGTSGLTATDAQAAIDEVDANLDAHIADATDAHDASAISNVPAGNLAATDVQSALNELQTDIDTRATDAALQAHITDTTDAHDASAISVVPTGNLGSTDVQAALAELQGDIDAGSTGLANHLADPTDAHDASAISVVPTGNLAADDVQEALTELQGDIDTHTTNISNLVTLSGVAANSTHLGTFTGTTIPDNQTIKQALQALETEVEQKIEADSVDTLTNKTFDDELRLFELPGTPSTPPAGYKKLYPKDNGKLYTLDDTGLEKEVGSGSGSGINYILNSDAEGGTDGYVTYDDGAVAVPVDGTGGAPSALTFTSEPSTALRGTNLFRISRSAASALGEGVSYDLFIDEADMGKKLVISFDYTTSANYVDGDIKLFVYDDTNGVLIRVNGEDLRGNSAKGTHYAAFQASSNSTSYRLIWHVAVSTTTAWTVDMDNIQLGPKNIVYGTPVTDWESFTPTGSWVTNTTYTGKYRRVGDTAEIEYRVSLSGAPTAAILDLNLPSGLIADTSKLVNGTTSESSNLGYGAIGDATAGDFYVFPRLQSTTSVRLLYLDAAAAQQAVTATAPMTFATGDSIGITIKVPIVGWSSNAKMSEDFLGRQIYTVIRKTSDQITQDATNTKITFQSAPYDYTGAADLTNNRINIQETGLYLVQFFGNLGGDTANWEAGEEAQFTIQVNGVPMPSQLGAGGGMSGIGEIVPFALGDTSNYIALTSPIMPLNKGDYVEVFINNVTNAADENSTVESGSNLIVCKLNSAQQIFETETIVVSYTSDSGQTIPTSVGTLLYEDKILDTHGWYNTSTGALTIGISGIYEAYHDFAGDWTPSSANANQQSFITLNGTNVANGITRSGTTSAGNKQPRAYMKPRQLSKGDILTFRGSSSEASTTMDTVSTRNGFGLKRIK